VGEAGDSDWSTDIGGRRIKQAVAGVLPPPRDDELYSTGEPRLILKPMASVRRKLSQCLYKQGLGSSSY